MEGGLENDVRSAPADIFEVADTISRPGRT
jgi:hypothetical protein